MAVIRSFPLISIERIMFWFDGFRSSFATQISKRPILNKSIGLRSLLNVVFLFGNVILFKSMKFDITLEPNAEYW